jgi:hypothetical protein
MLSAPLDSLSKDLLEVWFEVWKIFANVRRIASPAEIVLAVRCLGERLRLLAKFAAEIQATVPKPRQEKRAESKQEGCS